ncbi:unnamed protein product [Phytophthora fragariaefolia]|uniref:Unnamed protein product n=1 Tax=Phytophthora fragariaefolia TaxID=1490495 RepID=A0A9W6XH74_9STRA|nr:unnamed protein product [Phytophthora fragariaefolia]
MARCSKTCPKYKKRFGTPVNMKRHQNKVFACGAQFIKQHKDLADLAKQKKAYRNRYDYLKRLGRLPEHQGPLPPFDAPRGPRPRRSTRRSTTTVESSANVPAIVGPIIVHAHYHMDGRNADGFYN